MMIVFEWIILSLLVIRSTTDDVVEPKVLGDILDDEHAAHGEDGTSHKGLGFSFYKDMNVSVLDDATRRMYGGDVFNLKEFPAVCALCDSTLEVRCTGSALTSRWVLTAAHCVMTFLAFVNYNTQSPRKALDGTLVAIDELYIHPRYVVKQVAGTGGNVVQLNHDVGLVHTELPMTIDIPHSMVYKLHTYNPYELLAQNVTVLGYGMSEKFQRGDVLFGVSLQLAPCGDRNWVYCVCGYNARHRRGVCSGDSGGPVLYKGVMVGITSLGTLECTRRHNLSPMDLTSVFTSLYQYVDVINDTIYNGTGMMLVSTASRLAGPLAACVLSLLLWIYIF